MKLKSLKYRLPAVLLLCLSTAVSVFAADSVSFLLRINSSVPEESYRGNASAVRSLDSRLASDSLYANIGRVRIRAAASPDGPLSFNRSLAAGRAEAMVDYLLSRYPSLPLSRLSVSVVDEDWEGLASFIRRSSQPWKDEALQIVNSGRADRKAKLKELYVGEAWEYLRKYCFPLLRKVSLEIDSASGTEASEDSGASPQAFPVVFRQGSSSLSACSAAGIPAASLIRHSLRSLPKDSPILLTAASSPEGAESLNDALARKRGEAVVRVLKDMGFTNVRLEVLGEDWAGLLRAVKESYTGSNKDSVLSILEDVSLSSSRKKSAIMALDGGRTWRSMFGKQMAALRAVRLSENTPQ